MKKIKRFIFILILPFAACLLALTILVSSGLKDHVGKADVALVFGNTVNPDGKPSARLRARLDKALELYRAGYFPTIIVSGGIGIEGYDEAKVMRDYLVSQGISDENIIMDNEGKNTADSAKNTLRFLQETNNKSVFVISQYFHVPRACLILKRYGISTVYSAHPNYFEWRDVYSALREVVGYGYYAFYTL